MMGDQGWTNVGDLPVPPIMTGCDDYAYGSSCHVPRVLHRVLLRPQDVVEAAHEGMRLHHVDVGLAASRSGVSHDVALDVIDHGRGRIRQVIDVLAAVGVDAVTVPTPASLSKGV